MPKDFTKHPVVRDYINALRSDEEYCFLLEHDDTALSNVENVTSNGPVESQDGNNELNELFLHALQPEAQFKLGRVAHLRAQAFRVANFDLR